MKQKTLPPNGESPARNGLADTFNSYGRAIRTKYFGPTNCKGSRVRAWIADDGKPLVALTVSWDYSLAGPFENHAAAALAVLEKARNRVPGGYFALQPVHLAGSYIGNGEYAFAINARDDAAGKLGRIEKELEEMTAEGVEWNADTLPDLVTWLRDVINA